MKRRAFILVCIICLLLGLTLTGCADDTFETIVDSEMFVDVPLMTGEKINFSEVQDVGGENYLIWAYDTNLDEYKDYLKLLEKNKYTKYTDNGEEGIENYVYTAHYQKDNLLVVVTHYTKLNATMISACKDAVLSEHLLYKDEYVKDNISDAKTTFTMLELADGGNSFVFQLKNGHYIINDGGTKINLPHLLDYLETNAPNGEKPIIDAWIISHSHVDHMGVLQVFMKLRSWAERIRVEGVYFTEASEAAHEERRGTGNVSPLTYSSKNAGLLFKTSEGETTPFHRMREGERYYFNDITMDVIYVQDILDYKEWTTWNATSTVLMYTIEGQKVFLTADTDYECQMLMLDIFDDSYFDLTIYQAPHHGGNVYDNFTRHLTIESAVKPSGGFAGWSGGLLSRYTQNQFLGSRVKEYVAFGDGGVTFTFPYEAGNYERLPLVDRSIYEEELKLIEEE